MTTRFLPLAMLLLSTLATGCFKKGSGTGHDQKQDMAGESQATSNDSKVKPKTKPIDDGVQNKPITKPIVPKLSLVQLTQAEEVTYTLPTMIENSTISLGAVVEQDVLQKLDFVPTRVYALRQVTSSGNKTIFRMETDLCGQGPRVDMAFYASKATDTVDRFGMPSSVETDGALNFSDVGVTNIFEDLLEIRPSGTVTFDRIPTAVGDYFEADIALVVSTSAFPKRYNAKIAGRLEIFPPPCP